MLNELLTNLVIGDIDLTAPGLYIIICNANCKVYVGQQQQKSGFKARWAQHKYSLRNNSHGNKWLQNIYNKYGVSSLQFLPIENCSINLLDEREQFYIDLFKNYSVNLKTPIKTVVNKFWDTEEGKKLKIIFSNERKGKKLGPMTDEQINNLKIAKKKYFKNHSSNMKGKTHSEETKKLLSKFHSERKREGWKITKDKHKDIKNLRQEGLSITKIAELFKVERHTISLILKGIKD